MRRQDIQLRAAARQGDSTARLELARRYLHGTDGFSRNVSLGIGYLSELPPEYSRRAAHTVADALRLDELLSLQQMDKLALAAQVHPLAQVKLGAWSLAVGDIDAARCLFSRAANAGDTNAQQVLNHGLNADAADATHWVLGYLERETKILRATEVAVYAAETALQADNLRQLDLALEVALRLQEKVREDVSELMLLALGRAEVRGEKLVHLSLDHIQSCLEHQCALGDGTGCFYLGRALCGIQCGAMAPESLVRGPNLRKGTALLLRAADIGEVQAWMHLYKLSSEYRSSVANLQMARFYLEKAAQAGHVEGQRRLGALLLRDAATLRATEQAIDWLYRAAAQGDTHAPTLLASLVFPVQGRDEDAALAIAEVHKFDPWLAARLRLARDFGLTKLEALTVNPIEGRRRWGLVVGQNPYISHVRLAAPRAVPALTRQALSNLNAAVSLFGAHAGNNAAIEGDLRRRSAFQRRLFERLQLNESNFFATANSSRRDVVRVGSRWAHHSKAQLQMALA